MPKLELDRIKKLEIKNDKLQYELKKATILYKQYLKELKEGQQVHINFDVIKSDRDTLKDENHRLRLELKTLRQFTIAWMQLQTDF